LIGYIAGLIITVLLVYCVFVERKALKLTYADLYYENLPEPFDGFTILQISDIHASHWWELERRMESAIRNIEREIDITVLTGDIAVNSRGARLIREFLKRVNTGHKVYAVYGNTEHKGEYGKRRREDIDWEELRVLVNEHIDIERDGEKILVAGVDDPFSRHDNLIEALSNTSDHSFRLLIAHSPDVAGEAVLAGIDLLLTGHTHGGQVRLPVVGVIYPHLRKHKKLIQGLFAGNRLQDAIGQDPKAMRVYVSRGIGISNLPIRFLCPPELVCVTLHTQKDIPHPDTINSTSIPRSRPCK
jgi:uncharacterized protein